MFSLVNLTVLSAGLDSTVIIEFTDPEPKLGSQKLRSWTTLSFDRYEITPRTRLKKDREPES